MPRLYRSLRPALRGLALAVSLATAAAAQTPTAFRVQVAGHGPAMVLLPGLASSGATWDSTVAHFQARYTCYTLTLAGFAGVPPIAQPLLATARVQLAAYIRAHHLAPAVMVGHSLGGTFALDFAEHYPRLVGSLVIVDALPFYAGAWFGVKNLAAAQPILAQMRAGMAQETQAGYLASARSGAATQPMTRSRAHQQELVAWGVASDMGTVNRAMEEMLGADLRPGLTTIASPTLVLGTWRGWQESLAGRGVALQRADFVHTFAQQYAGLKRMHFAMADHARHFVMWDDPAWFFQQLDAFLARPAAGVRVRGF